MLIEKKCKKHWEQLGILSDEQLKTYINAVFEKHSHQQNVLIELYEMIFPNWSAIKKIHGHPEVGKKLWHFICCKFIDFDQMHHPGVFKGGAWLNWGFSTNPEFNDWEISTKNCSLEFKGEIPKNSISTLLK